jgi:O-antigen ligase
MAIAGVTVFFIAESAMHSRLVDPSKGVSVRVSQWKAASLAFIENPVLGVGYRQFEKQSADLKKRYRMPPDKRGRYFKGHAHNNFLEAFASIGLFGGVSFLAFCLFWVLEMVRSTHAKYFFLPVVTAFLVSGMFENTFTDSEVLNSIMLFYFLSQVTLDWEEERIESVLEENIPPRPAPILA